MEQRITRFCQQVETYFGGRPGRGARYSDELRAGALAIVRDRLAKGARLSSVAGELGLRVETLRRWLGAARSGGRELRPVEVVVEDGAGPVGSWGMGLVLVTANGHRVEGLALAQVAQLLEVLG